MPFDFRSPRHETLRVRLGLLGPADGDVAGLARAAEFLLDGALVDRAIYLGDDRSLEAAVVSWAMRLVGHDPTDEGAWEQAAELALRGTPAQIDWFVRAQRARLRLRALESLPSGQSRTIEMIGDRVAILLHDKGLLDEEDIFAAHLLVYGRSDGPLVKRIGNRWFMTPGPIGEGGGVAVLDEDDDQITATLYDVSGRPCGTHPLTVSRAANLRVQGDT
jgi:hypothetical protein